MSIVCRLLLDGRASAFDDVDVDVEEFSTRGGDQDGVFDDHHGQHAFFVVMLDQQSDHQERNVDDEEIQQEIYNLDASAVRV